MKTLRTFDVAHLEDQADQLAKEVGIKTEMWQRFMRVLNELKQHNEFMYAHSLRVGIYTCGLANHERQTNLKFPLFAGCGHDVGKCEIANALLDSKNLQPEEFEQIKRHTTEGYARLKDSFLFTGFIAGLHHKYKPDGYGIDLDTDTPFDLKDTSKQTIIAMAQLVMLVDFFDALTTRDNNKGFIENPHDPDQQRLVMSRFFPDQLSRIEWLIAQRI